MARLLLVVFLFLIPASRSAEPTFLGKPLAHWETRMKKGTTLERTRAATALGLGPFGKKAVPAFIEGLASSDEDSRYDVLFALEFLGKDAEGTLPTLRNLLFDKNAPPENGVAEYLVHLGPVAIPTLLEAADTNVFAVQALAKLGKPAMPILLERLDNQQTRASSARALAQMQERVPDDALPTLLKALKDPRSEVRGAILHVLRKMGPRLKRALPELIQLLHSDDDCNMAVEVLRSLGEHARPAFRDALRNGSKRTRRCVILHLDGDWPETLPFLQRHLEDEDQECREAAAKRLVQLLDGSSAQISPLREALLGKDASLRSRIYTDLVTMCQIPEARRLLVQGLHDPDREIKEYVADRMCDFRLEMNSLIPYLLQISQSSNVTDRNLALHRLVDLNVSSPSVLIALCESLQDKEAVTRNWAARMLGKLGSGARGLRFEGVETQQETVIPALTARLHDPDKYVQAWAGTALCLLGYPTDRAVKLSAKWLSGEDAAKALMKSGPTGAVAVPLLIDRLKSNDALERCAAAQLLAALGPLASPAVDALARVVEKGENEDRTEAVKALFAIGKPVVSSLKIGLESENRELRWGIGCHLSKEVAGVETLVPVLLASSRDAKERTRTDALRSLRRIKSTDKKVLRRWIETLEDSWPENREVSCLALSEWGAGAKSAIPALLEATVDEIQSVREAALNALAAIAPDDASVQTCMTDMLSCRAEVLRLAAIQAMGGMGRHAEPFLPRLRALMNDINESPCIPAAMALWRVRGDKREVQPLFEKMYREGKGERRVEAVEAMRVVEPKKEQLVMLVRLLEDGEARYQAMNHLFRAGSEMRVIRLELEALLKHRESKVRQMASQLLSQLQR